MVASGHVYERLQKIIVLSMLRTTKCAALPPCRRAYIQAFGCRVQGLKRCQRSQPLDQAGFQALMEQGSEQQPASSVFCACRSWQLRTHKYMEVSYEGTEELVEAFNQLVSIPRPERLRSNLKKS